MQGVVGGLYARAQGEPEEVWQAIYDHYKPESMEDSIPRARNRRRLVSLADKLDTLRGCFRRRHDAHRLARSVRVAPRRAGRSQDHGGRRLSVPLPDLIAGDPATGRDSSKIASNFISVMCAASATTKSTPPWPQAGAICRNWKHACCACKKSASRPISSRWPPVSNASRTSCGRPSSRRRRIRPGLLEPGPEKDLYDEISARRANPLKSGLGSASQSGSLLRQGAGECAGAGVRQQSSGAAARLLEQVSTFADFSEIVTNS